MNSYLKLSYYYDEMMEPINYHDWYQFTLPYLKKNDKLLDLACGTGTLLSLLANEYDCYGLDLSDYCIEIAHQKAKMNHVNINYKVCDMSDFSYDTKFNVITCYFDSVNFLTKEQVGKMMDCVYDCLEDGGYFIFDLFTYSKMKAFNHTTLKDSLSVGKYKWKMKVKNNILYHDITINDEGYKVNEKYFEVYYDYKEIIDSRFKLIKVVTDFKDSYDEKDERVLVVLQK